MDEPNEADETYWRKHMDSIMTHVDSVSTRYARPMAAWSRDAEGYDVVNLPQFRVDDGGLFRETVGAITSVLKEAEYEHLGSWYDMIGNSSNEQGYFVVSHFENFAAMDEDRASAYSVVSEHAGQARADELWEQFEDALHIVVRANAAFGGSPESPGHGKERVADRASWLQQRRPIQTTAMRRNRNP